MMNDNLARKRPRSDDHQRAFPTEGRERWRFLAEASAILDDADDPEEIVGALLRVAVPQFADLCVLRLSGDAAVGRARMLMARPEILHTMARHASPARPAELAVVRDQDCEAFDATTALPLNVDDALLERIACDDAQLLELRALQPATALAVPITTRGRCHGTVYFLTVGASARRYRRADVPTALDLVHRFASAYDRALRQRALQGAVESLRVRLSCAV